MRARKAGLSCEVLLASRRRAIWSLLHSATVEPLRTPLSSVRVCAARARKLGALVECREAGLGLACKRRAYGKLLAALVRSISQALVPEGAQPQGAERSRCGRQSQDVLTGIPPRTDKYAGLRLAAPPGV